jgi:hypothetical protein
LEGAAGALWDSELALAALEVSAGCLAGRATVSSRGMAEELTG